MLDVDGIERPDDPHAHMRINRVAPQDKHIGEDYAFVSHNPFFKFCSQIVRRVGIALLGPYIRVRYRLKIIGKHNIKAVKKMGCVVTLNHVHDFDEILVASEILNHRKCYFVTLKNNINMPFLGRLLKLWGGIPVPTTVKAMREFENSVNDLLQNKKAVIISPEASLWPYYRGIRPFKRGAFKFAVKNHVPILPIVIVFRRKPIKNNKFKYYFTAIVGAPFFSNIDDENLAVKELHERTYNYYKSTTENFYNKYE